MVEIKGDVLVQASDISDVKTASRKNRTTGRDCYFVTVTSYTGLAYNVPCKSENEAEDLARRIRMDVQHDLETEPNASLRKEIRDLTRKVDRMAKKEAETYQLMRDIKEALLTAMEQERKSHEEQTRSAG